MDSESLQIKDALAPFLLLRDKTRSDLTSVANIERAKARKILRNGTPEQRGKASSMLRKITDIEIWARQRIDAEFESLMASVGEVVDVENLTLSGVQDDVAVKLAEIFSSH